MKSLKLLLTLIPLMAIGAASASAAPLPRLDGAAATAEAPLVHKTHGWHHHCAWGPARYHRHVPGYGNVSCGAPGHGFYHRPYARSHVWIGPRYTWRHHGYWRHRGHRHWR